MPSILKNTLFGAIAGIGAAVLIGIPTLGSLFDNPNKVRSDK